MGYSPWGRQSRTQLSPHAYIMINNLALVHFVGKSSCWTHQEAILVQTQTF